MNRYSTQTADVINTKYEKLPRIVSSGAELPLGLSFEMWESIFSLNASFSFCDGNIVGIKLLVDASQVNLDIGHT